MRYCFGSFSLIFQGDLIIKCVQFSALIEHVYFSLCHSSTPLPPLVQAFRMIFLRIFDFREYTCCGGSFNMWVLTHCPIKFKPTPLTTPKSERIRRLILTRASWIFHRSAGSTALSVRGLTTNELHLQAMVVFLRPPATSYHSDTSPLLPLGMEPFPHSSSPQLYPASYILTGYDAT